MTSIHSTTPDARESLNDANIRKRQNSSRCDVGRAKVNLVNPPSADQVRAGQTSRPPKEGFAFPRVWTNVSGPAGVARHVFLPTGTHGSVLVLGLLASGVRAIDGHGSHRPPEIALAAWRVGRCTGDGNIIRKRDKAFYGGTGAHSHPRLPPTCAHLAVVFFGISLLFCPRRKIHPISKLPRCYDGRGSRRRAGPPHCPGRLLRLLHAVSTITNAGWHVVIRA